MVQALQVIFYKRLALGGLLVILMVALNGGMQQRDAVAAFMA
jgi:hypothetical protein